MVRAGQFRVDMISCSVVTVLFSGAINACGALILAPVLPFFMMDAGATAFDLAMISSIYSLAQMVSSPLFGTMSDKYGRKRIMLLGLCMRSILYLLQSFAGTVPTLILVRAALGFAGGTGPVEIAFITDWTSDKERPKILGLQTSLATGGALLGPAIGGFLAPYGFPFLCYIMTGVCFVNFVVGVAFLSEPGTTALQNDADEETPETQSWMLHLIHPVTGTLLFAGFLDCFALAVSDGPEAMFLKDHFGFGAVGLGKFFMMCAASGLFWANLAPSMLDRLGFKTSCILGSLGSASVMATLLVFTQWWEPYLYAFVSSCTCTLVEIACTTMLGNVVPAQQRGTVFGLNSALLNAGFFLGPGIGGFVYDRNNYVPYLLSVIAFLLSAVAYSMLPRVKSEEPLLSTESPPLAVRRQGTSSLEHMSNMQPLPNKLCAPQIVALDARWQLEISAEMYSPFMVNSKEHSTRGFHKSHTIGVASMIKQMEHERQMKA